MQLLMISEFFLLLFQIGRSNFKADSIMCVDLQYKSRLSS